MKRIKNLPIAIFVFLCAFGGIALASGIIVAVKLILAAISFMFAVHGVVTINDHWNSKIKD